MILDKSLAALPRAYELIGQKSREIGFDMPSDTDTGVLLRLLVASKPNGRFLEIGTGTGLGLSWILDGAQGICSIQSVDNNAEYQLIAKDILKNDKACEIILTDAAEWLTQQEKDSYDLIFADAWPGKYELVDETITLLKLGGYYVIDDMLPQANWPQGHQEKAEKLKSELLQRNDLFWLCLPWSTGVMIGVRKQ